MKKKLWVLVLDYETELEFTFHYTGSTDIVFETRLTPNQLLQIFQQSGIDFNEDDNE